MNTSLGVRRLAIAVGAVPAAAWFAFMVIALMLDAGHSTGASASWFSALWVATGIILFVGGWGIVRLVAWVIDGFKSDRRS